MPLRLGSYSRIISGVQMKQLEKNVQLIIIITSGKDTLKLPIQYLVLWNTGFCILYLYVYFVCVVNELVSVYMYIEVSIRYLFSIASTSSFHLYFLRSVLGLLPNHHLGHWSYRSLFLYQHHSFYCCCCCCFCYCGSII